METSNVSEIQPFNQIPFFLIDSSRMLQDYNFFKRFSIKSDILDGGVIDENNAETKRLEAWFKSKEDKSDLEQKSEDTDLKNDANGVGYLRELINKQKKLDNSTLELSDLYITQDGYYFTKGMFESLEHTLYNFHIKHFSSINGMDKNAILKRRTRLRDISHICKKYGLKIKKEDKRFNVFSNNYYNFVRKFQDRDFRNKMFQNNTYSEYLLYSQQIQKGTNKKLLRSVSKLLN
jgi:hypothetical protein